VAKEIDREIVRHFDREFANLINSLKDLASSVHIDLLYRNPPAISIGECILRSAAKIEQTCGGLTSNLWDDPFEWTLPETLATSALIIEYLGEVDQARTRAFASLVDDSALEKYIAMPSGEQSTIQALLVNALAAARDFERRAADTYKMLFPDHGPRFII